MSDELEIAWKNNHILETARQEEMKKRDAAEIALVASQEREAILRKALVEISTGKFPKEGDEFSDDSMRLFARNAITNCTCRL